MVFCIAIKGNSKGQLLPKHLDVKFETAELDAFKRSNSVYLSLFKILNYICDNVVKRCFPTRAHSCPFLWDYLRFLF